MSLSLTSLQRKVFSAMPSPKLECDIVLSLRPDEASDLNVLKDCIHWCAWKHRHWPADVVRRGLRLYGFNRTTRRLCVLLEVSRGGSFEYSSRSDLRKQVKRLTGFWPDEADAYTRNVPVPQNGERCHGVALKWKIVKVTDIAFDGKFPQLGWQRLTSLEGNADLEVEDEVYPEGDPRLRAHVEAERNPALRRLACAYWRKRLGTLRCIVCGFDFRKVYGSIGEDFIEMHHASPLGAAKGRRWTKASTLYPLCSNCHRMVHYKRGAHPLKVQQLKAMLRVPPGNRADF
jgi:hypothetical protein